MYESLTCFIDKIDPIKAGEWEIDDKHKGTPEDIRSCFRGYVMMSLSFN